ncbi:hypothetical protein GQX74_013286 [Glossina fuscipes]|nr:hypothetical protein GQX74_013286 [Glossina fuscipes]
MSFILPTAECDLHLDLNEKGLLNGITFAGMITSTIPWGFAADTIGRKKVLIAGLLSNAVFVVCCGFSQNVKQLLAFTFFDVNSWNIFLLITAVVPLLGGILHIFFPPSPKYLMSQGRNNEALKAIATAYAINKRSTKDAYPIKVLVDEAPERAERNTLRKNPEYKQNLKTLSGKRKEAITRFRENLGQLKPLLSKPYLSLALRVCFTIFHSVRLWMPQLFVTVDQYEQEHEIMKDICDVLNVMRDKTQPEESSNCDEVHITPASLANNMIVASVSAIVILVSLGFGRLGALLGNIIFPYCIQIHCLAPFLFISIMLQEPRSQQIIKDQTLTREEVLNQLWLKSNWICGCQVSQTGLLPEE